MAKKAVATFAAKAGAKSMVKCIRMEKSPKTGAYVFTEQLVEESKAKDMLLKLYAYYLERPEALPPDFQTQLDFEGIPRIVCDYIAGMTDKYAVRKYTELFIPSGWSLH